MYIYLYIIFRLKVRKAVMRKELMVSRLKIPHMRQMMHVKRSLKLKCIGVTGFSTDHEDSLKRH